MVKSVRMAPLAVNRREKRISRLLRVRGERGGVIWGERVYMLKSPVRRGRAGLGVQGVAGTFSLSR
jgi:hypothetical protein